MHRQSPSHWSRADYPFDCFRYLLSHCPKQNKFRILGNPYLNHRLYLLGAGLEYEIRWCYTNYSLRHSPGRQVAVCPSRALLPWRLNGAEVLQSAGRTEQAWHHHVVTNTFVPASQARARGKRACVMGSCTTRMRMCSWHDLDMLHDGFHGMLASLTCPARDPLLTFAFMRQSRYSNIALRPTTLPVLVASPWRHSWKPFR